MSTSNMQYVRAARRRGAEAPIDLSKRRAWYDDTGDPPPKPDTEQGKKDGEKGEEPLKLFTQADMDRAAADARRQARTSTLSDLAKKAGLEKPEEVETLLTDAQKKRLDEMTATERLQAENTQLKADRDAERKRNEDLIAEQRTDRRNTAVLNALVTAKAEDPELLLIWVEKNLNTDLIAVLDADGKVDPAKVKALVDKARTQKPKSFGAAGPGTNSNTGGRLPDKAKAIQNRASRTNQRNIRG